MTGCSLQTTMSDARTQFAACEALLNDGAVDACAAAAETLTSSTRSTRGPGAYERRSRRKLT